MITKPTVLILGAGASVPYGFPVGRKLGLDISGHILRNKDKFAELVANTMKGTQTNNLSTLRDFANDFLDSNQSSIDIFVENRPEYENIARLAIAAYLIPIERKDKLIRFPNEASTDWKWYEYLFSTIIGNNLIDFLNSNLKIITFNYDRSFEYALYYSLKASFKASDEDVREVINQMGILHIYGSLGQPLFINKEGRDYNPSLGGNKIQIAAKSIKLFTSEREFNQESIDIARNYIDDAEQICFLGFGYIEENVRRLFENKYIRLKNCWGTSFGIEEGEKKVIIKRFQNILGEGFPELNLNNMTNIQFLRSHANIFI